MGTHHSTSVVVTSSCPCSATVTVTATFPGHTTCWHSIPAPTLTPLRTPLPTPQPSPPPQPPLPTAVVGAAAVRSPVRKNKSRILAVRYPETGQVVPIVDTRTGEYLAADADVAEGWVWAPAFGRWIYLG